MKILIILLLFICVIIINAKRSFKDFNVLLPYCQDYSFQLKNSTCMNIISQSCSASSFKIDLVLDDLYVGIQYIDEDCNEDRIDQKFQFQCTQNEKDIFTNEYFQVACTNKIVINKEPPREEFRIRMEQFGLGINIDNSKDFLQLLNDVTLPPRIFTSPHKNDNSHNKNSGSSNSINNDDKGNHKTTNELLPDLKENIYQELKRESDKIKHKNETNTKNKEAPNSKNNSPKSFNHNNQLSFIFLLILIINQFF